MKKTYLIFLWVILATVVSTGYVVYYVLSAPKYTLIAAYRTPPFTAKNTNVSVLAMSNLDSLDTCLKIKKAFNDYEYQRWQDSKNPPAFEWQQIQCVDQTTGSVF